MEHDASLSTAQGRSTDCDCPLQATAVLTFGQLQDFDHACVKRVRAQRQHEPAMCGMV